MRTYFGRREDGPWESGRPQSGRWAAGTALAVLVVALALAACGKKGPPTPPPGEPDTYPRTYPRE